MIDVLPAHTREMIEPVRQLFAEYADTGGADLTSPAFLTELIELPGAYAPPRGRLIVAFEAAHLAGCGALRDLGEGACELRRLYVREEYRERGVERRILMTLLREAGEIGYSRFQADLRANMDGLDEFFAEAGFEASPEDDLLMVLAF